MQVVELLENLHHRWSVRHVLDTLVQCRLNEGRHVATVTV